MVGFKRIKGIGEKTAERIIIDLHDKVGKTGEVFTEKIGVPGNIQKQEALTALTLLGLDKAKSEKLIDKIMVMQPGIALEDLIKQVLKQLWREEFWHPTS